MNIFYISNKPHIDRRIVETRNSGEAILDYDSDNAYPQRMRSYALQSGTLLKCLRARKRHIIGKGCKDTTFYKAKINTLGQTVDQLLRAIIEKDYVYFDSCALHIKYNANYEKTSVRQINFDYCRLGKLDDFGFSSKIAVYDDWDRKMFKRTRRTQILYYDKYNPDPDVIEAQVEAAGGWQNWRGQILYFTPFIDEYPLASFDAIVNETITDYEISNYDFREVTSDFSPKLVYKHPTKLSKEERSKKEVELQEFEGPEGGKIMMIENAQPDHNYFEPIDTGNTDERYQQTFERVDNKIRSFYNIPPIIVGEEMSVGLGNSEIIKNAFDLYNSITYDDRLRIEELLKDVFTGFKGNINSSGDYSIIPLDWETKQV